MATPGWYRDPTGRFTFRYHNGVEWTHHVVDERGHRGTDPVGAGPPRPTVVTTRLTIGKLVVRDLAVIVAVVSGLLVVWSAFDLAFLDGDGGASLHQLATVTRRFSGWPLSGYAELGRFATLPVAGLAVMGSLRWQDMAASTRSTLATIAAVAAGALGLWHLLAMFVTGELDAAPALGAWIGVVGFVGLTSGPLIRRRAPS